MARAASSVSFDCPDRSPTAIRRRSTASPILSVLRASFEMQRIDTGRVIAAVSDQYAIWDGTACQLVCHAVRIKQLSIPVSDLTVTGRGAVTLPFPALIWCPSGRSRIKAVSKRRSPVLGIAVSSPARVVRSAPSTSMALLVAIDDGTGIIGQRRRRLSGVGRAPGQLPLSREFYFLPGIVLPPTAPLAVGLQPLVLARALARLAAGHCDHLPCAT